MNRPEQRKFHYIYRITRLDESGRYYIGMHSTDDLEDGYLGSGQILWRSIKKHGKEKHIKEILEFLPTRDLLKLREKELITKELVDDKLCMNLVPGGGGGSDVGRLGAESLKRKRQDPEFEKQYQIAMFAAGAKFKERRLSEPGFRDNLCAANKVAAKIKKQKRLDDPEYDRMVFEKMSAIHLGRKDSEEAKANKKIAQMVVVKRDPEAKRSQAENARKVLASKTSDEMIDIKRRQSEGAKTLAKKMHTDPQLRAEIMAKKLQTRIRNGTLQLSLEARAKVSAANKGKKRSPEVIQRARERTGELTTAFGTVWMNLNGIRKRVKKQDIMSHEQQGFVYGRS